MACVIPCGALDLIRIVHLNGFVEELTGPITADEVLKANPSHVLTKPTSQGMARRILVLSPETELKRGTIYFLIPSSSLPEKKKTSSNKKINKTSSSKKSISDVVVASVETGTPEMKENPNESCRQSAPTPRLFGNSVTHNVRQPLVQTVIIAHDLVIGHRGWGLQNLRTP